MFSWVSFSNPTDLPVEGILCKWFYESTPEQQRAGDLACIGVDDFVRYVRCYEVRDIATPYITVDLSTLHPIQHAYTLFYRVDKQTIHVMGGILYDDLVQMNGEVILNRLFKYRCRGFFAPYSLTNDWNPAAAQEAQCFYWNARFGEATEYAQLAAVEVPRCAFAEKMEWYRVCERLTAADKMPPVPFEDEPDLDRATSFMARFMAAAIEFTTPHILNTPVDPRKLRVRFDCMRYEAEHRLFMERMSQFTTEKSLIELFFYNGLEPLMHQKDAEFLVDGDAVDHQVLYAKRKQTALYEPQIFLNLPVEEIPPALIAGGLPIHPGGKVHLPFYWDTIAEWLWYKYMDQMHIFYTQTRSYTAPPTGPFGEWIKHETLVMTRYMLQHKPGPQKRRFGRGGGGRGAGEGVRQAQDQGVDIEDLESFWSMMPPCMAAVRTNGRFPRNFERLRFVQVLWMAGLSEESITAPLRELNEQYPRDAGAQRLENRFNVKSALNSIRAMDKQKATNWCSNIIGDTMYNRQDQLHCPFVKEVTIPTGASSNEVSRMCRPLCSPIRFSSPQELIAGALKNGGQAALVRKVEEEEKQTPAFTDSEESSVEDEADLEPMEHEIRERELVVLP